MLHNHCNFTPDISNSLFLEPISVSPGGRTLAWILCLFQIWIIHHPLVISTYFCLFCFVLLFKQYVNEGVVFFFF